MQSEDKFVSKGFGEFVQSLESADGKAFKMWAAWCRESSPLAFYRSAKSLVEWSDSGKILDLYESLRHKAYIHGDHGEITPIITGLAKEEVFSIPNSGHFMMIDNPGAFYKAIILRTKL